MTISDKFDFQARLPKKDELLIQFDAKEAQRMLLKKLREENEEDPFTLAQLASFYIKTGKQSLADQYIRKLDHLSKKNADPQQQAQIFLNLGSFMEQTSDYRAAVICYEKAVALDPIDPFVRYFAYNNLGFSLNQIKAFEEAEKYCLEATRINPSRANGFKNLALSLEGQGKLREAAENFIKAVKADASDPRSVKHLETLLKAHPELEDEFAQPLKLCQKAVDHIAGLKKQLTPKVHKGFRKQWILFQASIRKVFGPRFNRNTES